MQEIRRSDLVAQLVAENEVLQLKRRISFRRAMKKAMQSAMTLAVHGTNTSCAYRRGEAEMMRAEFVREGHVPLHTFKDVQPIRIQC